MTSPVSKEEKIIRTYLSDIGVRYDLAGYTYLVEVIEYILSPDIMLYSVDSIKISSTLYSIAK